MTTSCLPTALILHRGHWSGSYWFFFFLSLSPSFSSSSFFLSICLALRSLCPGQEDQAWGDGRLPQQPTTWRAKRRERWPQPRTGWVSSDCPSTQHTHTHTHTHIFHGCKMFNLGHVTSCMALVWTHLWCPYSTTWAAAFMCGSWTKLIKTRIWHHLCCTYISSERWWMKNKLQRPWVSSSDH